VTPSTELQAELAARRVLRWPVPDTGFVAHSAGLGELASVFDSELAGLRPQAGRIPMYSTVTGQLIEGSSLDAGYWFDNVRREVAFSTAVETLAGAGHRVFIECSPHPVLTTAIAETLDEAAPGAVPVITGTLDRADGGPRQLLSSLAAAHVAGVRIDWASVLPPAPRVELPTYAFQNQRYWMRQARPKADTAAAAPVSEQASESRTAGADSTRTVAGWRYQVTWKPVPDPGPGTLSGNWLVVVPAGSRVGALSTGAGPAGAGTLGEAVARALTIGGATVSTVEVPHGGGAREVLAAQLNSAVSNGAVSNLEQCRLEVPSPPGRSRTMPWSVLWQAWFRCWRLTSRRCPRPRLFRQAWRRRSGCCRRWATRR
jgi:acyl transferase domain-containing protein